MERVFSKLVIAMLSSCCTLVICHPIETIRTRMLIELEGDPNKQTYKNFRSTSKYISNMMGSFGVYRGFLLANLINLPFTFLFMMFYEGLSRIDLPNLYGAVSLSSFLGSCVVYPLDTVKFYLFIVFFFHIRIVFLYLKITSSFIRRKIQIFDSKQTIVHRNSWDCLKSVYHKEGISGLYSGLGAHIAKFGLAGPINFLALKTIHSLYYS